MTRTLLQISPRAAGHIEHAARWWRKNRHKAPTAFEDDLRRAFDVIRANPTIGQPVTARRSGVRRYWLDRVGYFVYYSEPQDGVIVIHALWHAARKSPPPL